MIRYRIASESEDGTSIQRFGDGIVVSFLAGSNGNRFWHEYEEWLAAGNVPEPPTPLPEPVDPGPSLADRVEAAETIIDLLLMEGVR